MVGRGGRAEFQRVGQDARQHRPLDLTRGFGKVGAHDVMHHRRGAGQRADHDVDRHLGFQPADQHVMVDDRHDRGIPDRGRQFGRVVGVDDHHPILCRHVGNDVRLGKAPVFQHKGGFGVGFAQQHRLGIAAPDIGQIPGPDDGGQGGVGVRRFVAENERGHRGVLRLICPPYRQGVGACHPGFARWGRNRP